MNHDRSAALAGFSGRMSQDGILAMISSTEDACLLYTSDAADERSSVDLGGRRIIKKKKQAKEWNHDAMKQTKK